MKVKLLKLGTMVTEKFTFIDKQGTVNFPAELMNTFIFTCGDINGIGPNLSLSL